MGRGMHKEWVNFTPIRDETGKIIGAKCNTCGKSMKKTSSDGLKTHRDCCLKTSNTLPTDLPNSQCSEETINGSPANSRVEPRPENSKSRQNDTSCLHAKTALQAVSSASKNIEKHGVTKVVSKKLKDKRILEYLLSNNLSWEHAEEDHFKRMISAFDSTYTVPSPQEFKEVILDQCFVEYCGPVRVSSAYLIGIVTKTEANNVYCISFCISPAGFTYISATDFVFDATASANLEKFVKNSVETLYDYYEVKLNIVMIQGSVLTACKIGSDIGQIFVCRSLLTLIESLKTNLLESDDNLSKVIKTLESKIKDPNYCLSNSVEDIFAFYKESLIDQIYNQKFNTYLCPLTLASNHLHSSFKGHHFLSFDTFKNKMRDFINSNLPVDAFIGYAAYKDCRCDFKDIEQDNYDNERYWSIISLNKLYKPLAIHAYKISSLPCFIRDVKIEKIKQLIEYKKDYDKSHDKTSEKDKDEDKSSGLKIPVLGSIILND